MIAVAFSGGADSLMTLLLLQEQGYKVFALHGIFLEPNPISLQNLKEQCAKLHIKLHLTDLRKPFRQHVINPFILSYLRGETPNPCAWCNQRIKFGLLLEDALELGAEKLATGHYAQSLPVKKDWGLFRGQDPAKDQSYFLSLLSASIIPRLLFPLGKWTKKNVQETLYQAGLLTEKKNESQEICFIPEDYRQFLVQETTIRPKPGKIIGPDGTALGEHLGLWRYTLGQRKGLGIAHTFPLYVTGIENSSNTLRVGPKNDLLTDSCQVQDINFLVPFSDWPQTVQVKTRYRQKDCEARVKIKENKAVLVFKERIELPTPGQIATFYDPNGRVLAGATISSAKRKRRKPL